MSIEGPPKDRGEKLNLVETVLVIGYQCYFCGRPTASPEQTPIIGWHENMIAGGSCAGIGTRPKPITQTILASIKK